RMVSGLVLKELNGECFVICGFYKYTLLASTGFNLTVPARPLQPSLIGKCLILLQWNINLALTAV
ncbi:hypothetical protein N9482_05390, partial [Planktomarina temperata]|nr:hypothetical protein [Planktomarina temperata]